MSKRQEFSDKLQSELSKHGLSKHGALWAERALDPAGTVPATPIPDDRGRSSVLPTWTNSVTIGPPLSVEEDGQWDCCMFCPSGDNTHAIILAAPAGTDFNNVDSGWSAVPQFARTTLRCVPQPNLRDISWDRPGAISVAMPVLVPPRDYAGYRRTAASLTVHFSGPTMYDGGSVYAASFGIPARATGPRVFRNGHPEAGWYCVGIDNVQEATCREREFECFTRQVYVGEARDGIYMPQIIVPGPLASLHYAEAQPLIVPANNGALPPVTEGVFVSSGLDPIASVISVPKLGPDSWNGRAINWISELDTSFPAACDTAFDRSQTRVIIFRGLNKQASLEVKGIMSVEAIPQPTSLERPYMQPPACADDRAIAAYEALVRDRMPAYPANCNMLGLLPGIMAALAKYALPAARLAAPYALKYLADRATAATTEPKKEKRAPKKEAQPARPVVVKGPARVRKPKGPKSFGK